MESKMKIQLNETIIASADVVKTKEFYEKLFQGETRFDFHDFFYTMYDKRSTSQLSVVPHNGDPKWDSPWLSVVTDNLGEAIAHILDIGVDEKSIEHFGETNPDGSPMTGVTFRDPDGRLLMLLYDDKI